MERSGRLLLLLFIDAMAADSEDVTMIYIRISKQNSYMCLYNIRMYYKNKTIFLQSVGQDIAISYFYTSNTLIIYMTYV